MTAAVQRSVKRRYSPYRPCTRSALATCSMARSHLLWLRAAGIVGRVGLPSIPCGMRIKKLEADGVMEKRVALVAQDRVGPGVTIFVSIKTADHSEAWLKAFAERVGAMPEVLEFYRMAGDVDYMLRVVVPDIHGYDRFYKQLIAAIPLKNVTSRFAMEKIKSTTALPLP